MLGTVANGRRNFSILREPPQRMLREHQVTIDDDLEHPVCTLDKTRRGLELLVQFGRQPGGPWLVVSNNAVFDRYVHRPSELLNDIITRRCFRIPYRARARSGVTTKESRAKTCKSTVRSLTRLHSSPLSATCYKSMICHDSGRVASNQDRCRPAFGASIVSVGTNDGRRTSVN